MFGRPFVIGNEAIQFVVAIYDHLLPQAQIDYGPLPLVDLRHEAEAAGGKDDRSDKRYDFGCLGTTE